MSASLRLHHLLLRATLGQRFQKGESQIAHAQIQKLFLLH
jgi:hypothetical protein